MASFAQSAAPDPSSVFDGGMPENTAPETHLPPAAQTVQLDEHARSKDPDWAHTHRKGKAHVSTSHGIGVGYKHHEKTTGDGEDGNPVQISASETEAHAHVDTNGVGLDAGRSHTDGNGNTTGVTGDVGYNWNNDSVHVGGGWSTQAKDGPQTTISGGVDVGHDHVGGNLGVSHGNAGANASAADDVQVTDPMHVDDHWVVTWRKTLSGSVGGNDGAVNASVGGSSYRMGSRQFPEEQYAAAAAYASQLRVGGVLEDFGGSPTSVQGAYALAEGESRGSGSSSNLSGGLSASTGAAGTVGAGLSSGQGSEIEVQRSKGDTFLVTVTDSTSSGANVSAGMPDVSVTGSRTDSSSKQVTVAFDLSAPEGQQAFEEFCRTRQVPESGGKVVSTEDGKDHRTATGVDIGAIGDYAHTHDVSETHRNDEDGTEDEYSGTDGESQTYGSIGGVLGGEDTSASYTMKARRSQHIELEDGEAQTESEDVGYTISGTFSGDGEEGGRSNWQGMYNLAEPADDESHGHMPADVKSSGKWTVSADLSKSDVDNYVQNLESGDDLYGGDFASAKSDLQRRLRDAQSDDDKMRALTAYVAEKGYHALDDIRGGGSEMGSYDVELERTTLGKLKGTNEDHIDPNFPGRAGRIALENQVAAYTATLQDPTKGPAVLGSIEQDIAQLQTRRGNVADPGQYTDLPPDLRAQELGKIDGILMQLMSLRDQAAIESAKNQPGETDEQAAARQAGGDPAGLKDPTQLELYHLRDRISDAQAALDLFKHDCEFYAEEGSDGYDQKHAAIAATGLLETLEAGVAAQRLAFVHALADTQHPDQALAAGQKLEAQLTDAADLAKDRLQRLEQGGDDEDAERRLADAQAPIDEVEMPAEDAPAPQAAPRSRHAHHRAAAVYRGVYDH